MRAAWSGRRILLIAIWVAAVISGLFLGLKPIGVLPSGPGWMVAGQFFSGALSPAITYENAAALPPEAPAFLTRMGQAAVNTLRMALAAVSLSLAAGLGLGFLGSTAWWPERPSLFHRLLWVIARSGIALLRSVHELIWATLFLAAVGMTELTAVIAIALPYSGTLAKVFAEMVEEAAPDAIQSFRMLGARPLSTFFCGLVPRISAELFSYILYRFECGLRSAAVLGFIGTATLGQRISQSFENLHYREVWTALYILLALVLVFDTASGFVRRRLVAGSPRHPDRPLQIMFGAMLALVAWAWASGGFFLDDMAPERRWTNLSRFVQEARPWPIQQGNGSWGAVGDWACQLLFSPDHRGLLAAANTLAMSVVAIAFAGLLAGVLIPFGARTLATVDPYLPATRRPRWLERLLWHSGSAACRTFFVLTRSIPEYVWAFIFIALVSDQFWAAILALAVHNTGILGRLGAEVVENTDPPVPRGLRGLGASRAQIYGAGMLPLSLPRFLVYFFYRWETCLREGTVLGILGVATLGRLIKDARAFTRHDEMLFFVLLGALLVLLGDLASTLVRRRVRA